MAFLLESRARSLVVFSESKQFRITRTVHPKELDTDSVTKLVSGRQLLLHRIVLTDQPNNLPLELEKLGPETASEVGISVGHQVFGDTMEAYDQIKEQFR